MARLGPADAEAARLAEERPLRRVTENEHGAPHRSSLHTDPATRLPSERSAAWFRDIMTRRQLPDKDGRTGDQRARHALMLLDTNGLSQAQVSKAIDQFKNCPLKPTEASSTPVAEVASDKVPSGHYAIKSDSDGQIRFYRLKQGRKAGKYWIHLQHGDEETELWPNQAALVMAQIMVDPAGAMRLYGRHIGCCGKCHARLTNRISRLLDIGPVCGGHFYDPEIWKAMQRAAREALRRAGLDPDADVEDTDDLDRIRELARL